jgi:hypothetical protein
MNAVESQPVSKPETSKDIAIQIELMTRMLGVDKSDKSANQNEAVHQWTDKYAKTFRDIWNSDQELRSHLESEDDRVYESAIQEMQARLEEQA